MTNNSELIYHLDKKKDSLQLHTICHATLTHNTQIPFRKKCQETEGSRLLHKMKKT